MTNGSLFIVRGVFPVQESELLLSIMLLYSSEQDGYLRGSLNESISVRRIPEDVEEDGTPKYYALRRFGDWVKVLESPLDRNDSKTSVAPGEARREA